MSNSPLINELFSMTYHSGIKPGLDRITHLCEFAGNPHQRLPVVHVAGTNGKGSTSAMLASILQHAAYNVGLYTSPHIKSFNERIRVNGVTISDEVIEEQLPKLMAEARAIGGTFFEVTTVLAFEYFARQRVDVAVIETGLGGRLDATNIVQPLASIITSIDLDHTDYLGHTLPEIAREKAGIIKEGAPAIIGTLNNIADEHTRATVRSVFAQQASTVGTSVTFADDTVKVDVDVIHPDLSMTVSVIGDELLRYYDTDMAGRHQAQNIATLFAALPHLRHVTFIEENDIVKGLSAVKASTGLRARTQVIRTSPTVVLDVGHNPSGITALRNTLRDAGYTDQSWQVVFGAMRDKDVFEMLRRLQPLSSTLHLCAPDIERAERTSALEQLALRAGFHRYVQHQGVAEAVNRAIMRGPTVICGSFHVAEEALSALEG